MGTDRLIVGMPMHADGSLSDLAEVVNEFIEQLGRFELPVETVDERYTSIEAEALLKSQRAEGLRGRISKETIDSVAATVIAERWLKKE
jgi:putative Holliday junction resolvase